MHAPNAPYRFTLVVALALVIGSFDVAYASIPDGQAGVGHVRNGGAPVYTAWAAPTNLGSVVNSSVLDSGPAITPDGLSLYFYTTRAGGFGGNDIWVAHRATLSSAWAAPVNLGATINTSAGELVPAFSDDGHWMFFASDRAGGYGLADIYVSWRDDTTDDFAWEAPLNLGATVNTAWNDNGTGYFANGGHPVLFFGSDRPGGLGGTDLYMSALGADGTWGTPTHISLLSSVGNDNRPQIRSDGLEIFLYSDRPGGGGTDIWTATRASTDAAWSAPVTLGAPVNSSVTELHPYLSLDALTLFFSSARAGGSGSLDLYVTTRSQLLPATKEECKTGGWAQFGIFKNQGDCVSWIASDGRNAPD